MATLTPLKANADHDANTYYPWALDGSSVWQIQGGGTTTAWTYVDEAITASPTASVDTGFGGLAGANATRNKSLELTATDADFDAMLTLSIRYSSAELASPDEYVDDTGYVNCAVWNSAGTSRYAAGISAGTFDKTLDSFDGTDWSSTTSTGALLGSGTAPAYDKTGAFILTSAGLAASKADWDGAYIKFTFGDTRNMGSDSAAILLVDFELTGTYTTSGPAGQTWTGTAAATDITAVSDSFTPGAATWVGTSASIAFTAVSGTLVPGAITWTGSAGALNAAPVSGNFAAGGAIWIATAGTLTLTPVTGSFSTPSSIQTWTGTAASLTVTPVTGSYTAGAVTWTGATSQLVITAVSGSFSAGGGAQAWEGFSPPLTRTYKSFQYDTDNLTTFTVSGADLGTASADRWIVVAFASRGTGGAGTPTVTVAGLPATVEVVNTYAGTGNGNGIASVAVPTGTTGDIVVTHTAGQLRNFTGWWTVTGGAVAATSTDKHVGTNQATSTVTLAFDPTTSGGLAFAVAHSSNTGNTFGWDSLTQDDSQTSAEDTRVGIASGAISAPTFDIDFTATASEGTTVAAVAYSAGHVKLAVTAVSGSFVAGEAAWLSGGDIHDIAYVGTGTFNGPTADSTITATLDAGQAPGDLMIFPFWNKNDTFDQAVLTPQNGWTIDRQLTAGGPPGQAVAWKFATGTEGATETVCTSDESGDHCGIVIAYSGVKSLPDCSANDLAQNSTWAYPWRDSLPPYEAGDWLFLYIASKTVSDQWLAVAPAYTTERFNNQADDSEWKTWAFADDGPLVAQPLFDDASWGGTLLTTRYRGPLLLRAKRQALTTVTAVSGEFVGAGGGPQTWTGTAASATVTAVSGSYVPGAITWTGTAASLDVTAVSGSFLAGAQTWTGTAATTNLTPVSGTFVAGAATWTGTTSQLVVTAVSGTFVAGVATWTGTAATTNLTAVSGTFIAGAATWTGTAASVNVTALGGSFVADGAPQIWTATTAAIEVTAVSGWLINDQTWTGAAASGTISAVTGSFVPGAATWTGTAAATTIAAVSGSFVPGALTWTGTATSATIAAVTGSFVPGAATWTGTTSQLVVTATPGTFVAAAATWTGTPASVQVFAQGGSFFADGAPQIWTATTAAIEVTAVSGWLINDQTWTGIAAAVDVTAVSDTFVPGAITWTGAAVTVTITAASGTFAAGAATWTGTTSQLAVAAASGTFVAATTWTGAAAAVTLTAVSGTFIAGAATWTETAATVTLTAVSGTFVPEAVTWPGSAATVDVTAVSDTFIAGAATWTGTTSQLVVTAVSDTFGPGAVTWTGTAAIVNVTAAPGQIIGQDAPQTWTGTAATMSVVVVSGSFFGWHPDRTLTIRDAPHRILRVKARRRTIYVAPSDRRFKWR